MEQPDLARPFPPGPARPRLIDLLRGGAARWEAACWRDVRPERRPRLASLPGLVAGALLLAFAAFVALVLSHDIYLGNDSAQSYGHVWFIERSLLAGEGIPLRIPALDSGAAFTFPYAIIPWLPAALLRPLLGDWAVTASMGVGVGLLLLGIRRWLPRAASPLVMALVLINWQLWNSILQFQLPTIWAFALACLSGAEFDRERPRAGAALAVAALLAHPLMGGAALGLTVLAAIERRRGLPVRQIAWLASAVAVTSPAIWMFLSTPAVDQAMGWHRATQLQIALQRTSMLWWPWLAQRLFPFVVRWYAPLLLLGAALLFRNVWGSNPQNLKWRSLPRFPDYIAAQRVDPAAHYRVLTMSNQEDGMVQLLQAGATLTQSFFDESVHRWSFGSAQDYRCYLARTGADHVLVNAEWIRRGTSNEVRMLDTLVAEHHAELVYDGPAGTRDYAIRSGPPESCRGARARNAAQPGR